MTTAWRRILGLTYGEAAWLIAGIALLAYELWAVVHRDGVDVLTRAYRANMHRWLIWPTTLGVLMGHLHGPVFPGVIGNKWSPGIFIVLVACVLARDLLIRTPAAGAASPIVMLVLGLIVGMASWVGRP